jgi:predicted Ser/Thr protein kinase
MLDKIKQKGAYFTATNLKTVNGDLPIYKKNGVSTYYQKLASGGLAPLILHTSVKNASGAVMKLAAYKKKTATPKPAVPKPAPAAAPKTPSGYTKTNLKAEAHTGSLKNVYKKNSNGTYHSLLPNGAIFELPDGLTIVKPNGTKMKVANLMWNKTPSGYTKTNLKYGTNNVGFKNIYHKNGKYYTKVPPGKMMNVPNYVKLTKPNGSKISIKNLKSGAGPSAANTGYKKTNLKGVNSTNIYIKNGKYYKKYPTGEFFNLLPTTIVAKPSGAYVSVNNLMKGKAPAAGPFVGWTNTGKLSNNGNKVYKSNTNGELMVVKNGKISKTFKGKAKLLQKQVVASAMAPAPAGIAPVLTTSLVPVIKPGPDHIKAAETAYANAVKKVADKLKELQEATGTNNSKHFLNYKNATGNMGFVYMNRANTVTYKATTVKGFQSAMGWHTSLSRPKFTYFTRQVKLKYTQYLAREQLLFLYGKNVNSFENVRMSDIIDTNWFVAQDKYIRSMSSRQLFTMYGYSFKGDTWSHAHLGNYFDMKKFKTDLSNLGHQYFAFFFQARDFYKINSGKIDNDYNYTLDRVKNETDVNNLKAIMNMFINELNEIIRNAPPVTRTFIVFRGQADDKYLSGVTGNLYTTERFCSTSVDGDVSLDQFSQGHTLQRITLLKGSKCLLMFGETKFANELEILLPRGSTYQIVKKRTNVVSNRSTNFFHPSVAPKKVQNLVDIVLIGTVEKAPPVEAVPVTVIPQTNVQIMQKIVSTLPGGSLMKVEDLLGKGGYGAVYKASDPNFGNLAIKIQKKSNNSNAEVKALKKLKAAKIAPGYLVNKNIKATNNIKKLVPRNLNVGNNVSVLVSEMIRGSPLKKWYTGAPIPQNIKNKLANSISKMHSNGVIHGNLHRNNIIIGNNGKAYVIDFGKSLVTNKSFKSLNEANNYLKGLTGKTKVSHSKTSWYSNNKRTHFLDGNFVRRLK